MTSKLTLFPFFGQVLEAMCLNLQKGQIKIMDQNQIKAKRLQNR